MYTCLLLLFFQHPFAVDLENCYFFILEKKQEYMDIQSTSSADAQKAVSVVVPELIRWTAFQDFFETKALEVLYQKNGLKGADFSIGCFQMKPSFIEKLEAYIKRERALAHLRYVVIDDDNVVDQRKKRLKRLKNFKWQLRFAHVYWQVAEHRFQHIKFTSVSHQIHFFATAYNFGFLSSEKEIRAWQPKVLFPFGKKHQGEQAKYGDLAVDFYQKHAKKLPH